MLYYIIVSHVTCHDMQMIHNVSANKISVLINDTKKILYKLEIWFKKNKLIVNTEKTKIIILFKTREYYHIIFLCL